MLVRNALEGLKQDAGLVCACVSETCAIAKTSKSAMVILHVLERVSNVGHV